MKKADYYKEAVNTDLPDDIVDEEAFKALQEAYEGDPEDEA